MIVIIVSKLSRIDSNKMHTLYCRIHKCYREQVMKIWKWENTGIPLCSIVLLWLYWVKEKVCLSYDFDSKSCQNQMPRKGKQAKTMWKYFHKYSCISHLFEIQGFFCNLWPAIDFYSVNMPLCYVGLCIF